MPPSEDHRLRRTYLVQQTAGHDLAEQVQAFVLHFEERREAAVFLVDLAQQVLGFEFAQVQFAEQIEQRRIIQQHFLARRVGARQGFDLKCDHVIDTVVFAALFFI